MPGNPDDDLMFEGDPDDDLMFEGDPDDDLMFEGDPEAVDDAIDAEEAATYPEDEKDD